MGKIAKASSSADGGIAALAPVETALPSPLLHPLRWLRARIDAWVLRRVRALPGPVTVSRSRIYILPTRYGWGFALLCLVMLLGAMNYSNSMAFALCFLLVGLGLVAMHHTHATLVHLQLRAGRVAPVHAGETARFEFFIDNPAPQPRYSVSAGWARQEPAAPLIDVPARGDAAFDLPLPAPRRGRLRAGIVCLSSEFPLGLFHAWTWVQLDTSCVVYPRPAPSGLGLPSDAGDTGAHPGTRSGQDEFAGLRGYQRGDALHRIHWKSLPKSPLPMVKQFSENTSRTLWLDWSATAGSDVETRLSRLARAVLDAEQQGCRYGLRLPGVRLAPAYGEAHRHACLRALALFEAQA